MIIKKFHQLILETHDQYHNKSKDYFDNICQNFMDMGYELNISYGFTNDTQNWKTHPANGYYPAYIIDLNQTDRPEHDNNDSIINDCIESLKEIKSVCKKLEMDSFKTELTIKIPNFAIHCVDKSDAMKDINE